MWTHYVSRDLKPEILEDMPSKHEPKADRFNGDIDNDVIIPPVVNGEVSEESGPDTEVEAEPVKNGVDVSEEVVTNGEVTGEAAVEPEIGTEIPYAVPEGCEIPRNEVVASSEVLTEASASSWVSPEVSTNGTANGTDSEAGQQEEVGSFNSFSVVTFRLRLG